MAVRIRGTDLYSTFGAKATGEPQHFGTMSLHWEITERARIVVLVAPEAVVILPVLLSGPAGTHQKSPSEDRRYLAVQDSAVEPVIGPLPEPTINFLMAL
jgi:hypothetical protein